MITNILPFPRGTTWSGKGVVELDGSPVVLEGALFRVKDKHVHTGQEVEMVLRCVRNGGSSALTVVNAAGYPLLVKLSPDQDWERKAVALATAATNIAKPADPAYPASFSVPAGDLFYVVEQGYLNVAKDNVAKSVGHYLTANANSVAAIAAQSQYIWGVAVASAAAADAYVTAYVLPGFPGYQETATTILPT